MPDWSRKLGPGEKGARAPNCRDLIEPYKASRAAREERHCCKEKAMNRTAPDLPYDFGASRPHVSGKIWNCTMGSITRLRKWRQRHPSSAERARITEQFDRIRR